MFSCTTTYPKPEIVLRKPIGLLFHDKGIDLLDLNLIRVKDHFDNTENSISLAIDKSQSQIMVINKNKKSINIFYRINEELLTNIGNFTPNNNFPLYVIYNPLYMEAYISYENKVIAVKINENGVLPVLDRIIDLINTKAEKLLVSPDGNYIYGLDKINKKIVVIDRKNNFNITYLLLPEGISPSDFDNDEKNRLFITNGSGNNLIVINGVTGELIKDISLKTDNSEIIINPTRIKIYIPSAKKLNNQTSEADKKENNKKIYVISKSANSLYSIDYLSFRLTDSREFKIEVNAEMSGMDYITLDSGQDMLVVTSGIGFPLIPYSIFQERFIYSTYPAIPYNAYYDIVTMKN